MLLALPPVHPRRPNGCWLEPAVDRGLTLNQHRGRIGTNIDGVEGCMNNHRRIVITGIGLTAPNGNILAEFRSNLLQGVSGVVPYETRYMGKVLAGVCTYDPHK